MAADQTGGVFIYYPLNLQTPLYRLFNIAALLAPDNAQLEIDSEIVARYRRHMRGVAEKRGLDLATSLEGDFVEDDRQLTRSFRAFFPMLLQHTTLTEKAATTRVYFPKVPCFDNRCIEIKDRGEGIFITSRTLDAIELFANTLATSMHLNGQELAIMLGLQDPWPEHILYSWMTMLSPPAARLVFGLEELLTSPGANHTVEQLHDLLYRDGVNPDDSDEAKRGYGHFRLSLAMTWLALKLVQQTMRAPQDDMGAIVDATTPLLMSSRSQLNVDSHYLATLILCFIVLHEIGHMALGHNRVANVEEDTALKKIVEGTQSFADEHGGIAHNLMGTAMGHETGADNFALEVIEEDYRDPMLEVATLWCAALAGTNDDCGDWLDHFSKEPRQNYPSFAMRVWFLNGRFSSGERQGKIAQEITRQAEGLAKAADQPLFSLEENVILFRNLWQIAREEIRMA